MTHSIGTRRFFVAVTLALATAGCTAGEAVVEPPPPTPAQVRKASGLVYEVVEDVILLQVTDPGS